MADRHPGRRGTRGRGTLAIPQRTCVGCRQVDEQAALLRFASSAGTIVTDPERRLPGRGAYLHARSECLEAARRRRSLERVLGGSLLEGWVESVVRT